VLAQGSPRVRQCAVWRGARLPASVARSARAAPGRGGHPHPAAGVRREAAGAGSCAAGVNKMLQGLPEALRGLAEARVG